MACVADITARFEAAMQAAREAREAEILATPIDDAAWEALAPADFTD